MRTIFTVGVVLFGVVLIWPGDQLILAAVSGGMVGFPIGVGIANRLSW